MEQFTNLYQIARTLRFGLEPIGKTKDIFDGWLKNLQTDKQVENTSNLFAKDQNIKDAYLAIKPIMDKLHEQFIEESLTSDEAKNIDFSEYLNAFRDKDVRRSKKFEELEKSKRAEIGATYKAGERFFWPKIENAIKEQKEKKANEGKKKDENPNDGRNKKPYECLTKREMLFYLSANVKELANDNNLDEQKLDKHIKQFNGFWGYLSGYNQNRVNFYEVEKESSTAVATRIVHENLPIFCSNILLFEEHKEEYLSIYQYLKNNNTETKIKNAAGAEVEAEAISENVFQIEHFNKCLAQSQIEEYNRIIGNYNFLINLYKQTHSDSKIDEFENLKKQIGCGKKKSMFAALIKDRQSELTEEQKKKEIEEGATLTVETLLKKVKEAGDRMFKKDDDNGNEITTIPAFYPISERVQQLERYLYVEVCDKQDFQFVLC